MCGCCMYNYYGESADSGLCELLFVINPPELSVNDLAWNDAHIAITGVRLC